MLFHLCEAAFLLHSLIVQIFALKALDEWFVLDFSCVSLALLKVIKVKLIFSNCLLSEMRRQWSAVVWKEEGGVLSVSLLLPLEKCPLLFRRFMFLLWNTQIISGKLNISQQTAAELRSKLWVSELRNLDLCPVLSARITCDI